MTCDRCGAGMDEPASFDQDTGLGFCLACTMDFECELTDDALCCFCQRVGTSIVTIDGEACWVDYGCFEFANAAIIDIIEITIAASKGDDLGRCC